MTSCHDSPTRFNLQSVLSYEHLGVTEKFSEVYETSEADAHWVFREVKKMLWLMAETSDASKKIAKCNPFTIYHPMVVLDEMWHTFILFTADYAEFCEKHLGGFLHHVPNTRSEREKHNAEFMLNPEKENLEERGLIETQCFLIANMLGQETLRVWFWTCRPTFPIILTSGLKI